MFCPSCGLTKKLFLETGRFGCKTCHSLFLNSRSLRTPAFPERNISYFEKFLQKGDLAPKERDFSLRYRISRCFSGGFFPYFDRQTENAEKWAEQARQVLRSGRFFPNKEDHFRWEWITKEDFRAEPKLSPQETEFFSNNQIWAFSKKIGFLNSCPTNCGRGDRFSIQLEVSERERANLLQSNWNWKDIARGVSKPGLFRIQLSWKNLGARQKLFIQKILGLLDV
jgi:hypothetical protein